MVHNSPMHKRYNTTQVHKLTLQWNVVKAFYSRDHWTGEVSFEHNVIGMILARFASFHCCETPWPHRNINPMMPSSFVRAGVCKRCVVPSGRTKSLLLKYNVLSEGYWLETGY